MTIGAYSDTKAIWDLGKIATLREGKQIVPSQVQLVISDLCNHDCTFCAYRMSGYTSNLEFGIPLPGGGVNNNPNRMIPAEKAHEIVRDCADMGVGAIQFTGGGEPTVHPGHISIIANAQSLGLDTALVTNGAILREGWREVFPKLSWLRISLDAGSAETYAEVRRVPKSAWAETLRNIRLMVEHLKAEKARTVMGLSFIVTKENMHDICEAALLAREVGVPSIRFAAMFGKDLSSYYTLADIEDIQRDVAHAESILASDRFQVIDMFSSRLADLEQGAPDYEDCYYQEFNCYIGADLHVYRCCNTAYNPIGRVGSLKEQSLAEFWASDQKRIAYADFDARSCEHCAFNGKNRLINSMVGEEPVHASFV